MNYFIHPGWVIFCLLGVASRSFSEGRVFLFGALPLAVCFTGILLRIVATTGRKSFTQRFLLADWLRSWGKYSYAIYVFHWPLVRLWSGVALPRLIAHLRRTPWGEWLRHPGLLGGVILALLAIIYFLVFCGFFFGLGKLSWWAFEGPINGLKGRFEPRWRGHTPNPRWSKKPEASVPVTPRGPAFTLASAPI